MSRFAQRPARTPDERMGAAGGSSGPRRPGRSVYVERYSRAGRAREVEWTPVGEFDASGEFIAVEGWESRVGGWVPFDEFLEQRR